jgi:hypothetical protein
MTAAALPAADQAALASLVEDFRRLFGTRLHAVAAYGLARRHADGPLHALVLVDRVTFDDLAAAAPLARGWRARGIAVPLILERTEFERSLDVFPLEYGDILAHHIVVFGRDPFAGVSADPADQRRAVEAQAKGLLIHLREGFLEAGGDAAAVSGLVAASAPAFEGVLSALVRLCGEPDDDLAAFAGRHLGVTSATIDELQAAGRAGPSAVEDLTPLFMRCLEAAERIWQYVDGWQAGR